MPIHLDVLDAARRVADGTGIFQLAGVVAALPHLNAATVRTHVASRCCANAPRHHQSRYSYFKALGGGRYRIEPRYRTVAADREVPSQDRLIDTLGSGTDLTLVDRSLRMTPTERLETMRRAALSLDAMRA